jgi:hypothetical protein
LEEPSVGPETEADTGLAARPALTMILPISFISTVLRVRLGIVRRKTFEAGVHRERDGYWDENEGKYYVSNEMSWYLRRVREIKNATNHREIFLLKAVPG